MPVPLTRAFFAPHIGGTFRMHAGPSTTLDLELVEVSELRENRERPFSILFRTPGTEHVPQGTYRLEHPEIGAIELFLVPIGPDREGRNMQYEAVFN